MLAFQLTYYRFAMLLFLLFSFILFLLGQLHEWVKIKYYKSDNIAHGSGSICF